MQTELSEDCQAVLLLTAPLHTGGGETAAKRLSAGEFHCLAKRLGEIGRKPADLLDSEPRTVLDELPACSEDRKHHLEPERICSLLSRGFLLSQVVDRWSARGIWVLSHEDAEYPIKLKERLRDAAPPVIYGCGDQSLLEEGGRAIVGSRSASAELLNATEAIGTSLACWGRVVISGGAKGIDAAAVTGALNARGEDGARIGRAAVVLADSLEAAARKKANREPLRDRRLVLVSPYDPSSRFNVGKAMGRNKLIYALADDALVVESDLEKGGTWAGAAEQLEKHRFLTVYVRAFGEVGDGLQGLLELGAVPWPSLDTTSDTPAPDSETSDEHSGDLPEDQMTDRSDMQEPVEDQQELTLALD